MDDKDNDKRRLVCINCGKPSKQRLCLHCRKAYLGSAKKLEHMLKVFEQMTGIYTHGKN
jgi:hypothetical protein